MKKIITLILTFCVSAALFSACTTRIRNEEQTPSPPLHPDIAVDIPDPFLKEGIIKTLQQMGETIDGDTVTLGDMYKLTELKLASPNGYNNIISYMGMLKTEIYINISGDISELTGLEYAVNLTDLSLCGFSISDIRALSGLNNLTHLYFEDTSISDIGALSSLNNLTELFMDGTISDIGALSSLKNLTYLYLGGISSNDISALSGLTNLIYLDLGNTGISDISALSGLKNLTNLYFLHDTSISDISALSGLKKPDGLGFGWHRHQRHRRAVWSDKP